MKTNIVPRSRHQIYSSTLNVLEYFFSDNISYLGFLMDYDQHISHYVQTRCLNFAQMNMMTRKIAGSYDTMATKLTSPVTTRVRNAFEVM